MSLVGAKSHPLARRLTTSLVCGALLTLPVIADSGTDSNGAPTAAVAQLPRVDALMASLLARLPSKPILITGDLLTTSADGGKSRMGIAILLSYPRMARYTLFDSFGEQTAELTVTRENGQASYTYTQGPQANPAPVPAPGEAIAGTALSWMDLTLGFLWWQGGTIIGREETRGQPCYVLDRRAPQEQPLPYASMRLWVDTRVSMLLQAEGYDKLGNTVRRLAVKSFKKINDEWMIKDLEVENLAAGGKTVLRVRNAEAVETEKKAAP